MATELARESTGPRATPRVNSEQLAARIEPFDSYWQAPEDIESGYGKFAAYYRANYLPLLPADRHARILVISCGPGYLIEVMKQAGYDNVTGIDSDAGKIDYARKHGLGCEVARGFEYLQDSETLYDMIIPEQELNHLTIDETLDFLRLARSRLKPGGRIIAYAMNGANPLVGSENLAHNIDHFYTLTEYSFTQILEMTGFRKVEVLPLKIYVFWKNPANYVGLFATWLMEAMMRVIFVLYGKKVKVLSKKLMAVAEAA
jgi:2-polyprenyl-3-methyl-5-hydroxy-6-metoxy-1,4-benzoquinol methylase